MKYQYVYLFAINNKIVWSGETAESLSKRAGTDDDKRGIENFIKRGRIGHFIELTTGEYIFQTS